MNNDIIAELFADVTEAEAPEGDNTQPPSQQPMVVDVGRARQRANGGLGRQATALGSMAVGTAAVMGLVVAMNAAVEPPEAKVVEAVRNFSVEKKPPPRKQEAPKPRKVRQRSTATISRAPLPNLGTAVGSLEFDLPDIEGVQLNDRTSSLLGDANRKTAMTADSVDDPPKATHRVHLEYPDIARERGIEGYVTLKLKVSAGGDVASIRVVDAQPRGMFEQAAVASVRAWKFDPGMYEGKPVETWVNQTVRFRLN